MYVLTLTFRDGPAPSEELRAGHGAWLREHVAAGRFLAFGPKASGDGGVIVARQMDRDELDALIAADPFVAHDVVDCDVLAFAVKAVAEGFDALSEPAAAS